MTSWQLVDAVAGEIARFLGFGAILMLGFSLLRMIGR